MIIHRCEKCGKLAEQEKGRDDRISTPTGWYTITHGKYSSGMAYDVCDDCRKSLGIPEKWPENNKHVGEQLLELIGEIVREEVENSNPN